MRHKEAFIRELGQNIVRIRKSKGLSQKKLALLSRKKTQSIERVENGKSNPSSFYLYEIAYALEIPVSKLLDFPVKE
jgi:transcriptional regulator with XRE-family HTH domain